MTSVASTLSDEDIDNLAQYATITVLTDCTDRLY